MKKGCLIAIGIGVVVIAGIAFFAFRLTGGIADAGNRILSLIGTGNVKEAAPASGATVSDVPVKDSEKQVPSDEKAKALALESLLAFNKGVQDKNFVAFREQISALWREQISAEKLKDVFQQFIDKSIDIAPIEKFEPVFDPDPAINSDGALVLKGSYPTKPQPVLFELKYVFEDGWKLSGINVELPPPQAEATRPAAPMPSDEQLRSMALESLLAFNKAVQDKDFSDFQAHCASSLRDKFSPQKLQEAFQTFVDKQVDISSIKNSQPSLESPPAIDADGTLVMSGSYDGKPKVVFKLKYRYEDNTWKIVGINVNLS